MENREHSTATEKLAADALTKSWRKIRGPQVFDTRHTGYVMRPEHNLVAGVDLSPFIDALTRGQGGELRPRGGAPPKFCATYSSAALVVNTFGPFWMRPSDLTLFDHNNFTRLCIEKECDTGFIGRPHLDVLVKNAGIVVGIESKCLEPLRRHCIPRRLSPSYDDLIRRRPEVVDLAWREIHEKLKSDPGQFRSEERRVG